MYEQLHKIIETKFQVPAEEITPQSTFKELGLDSLDLVELAVVVEQEIGVRITDDDLIEAGRLDAAVDLITSRSVAA